MKVWPFSSDHLPLGTLVNSFPLWPSSLSLTPEHLRSHHIYVVGTIGSGKTGLLKLLFLGFLKMGIGATFIDPHGDASNELLNILVHQGRFDDPTFAEAFSYLEYSEDDRDGYFLPLNVHNRPKVPRHLIAADVIDAMHRAWPALDGGAAPAFDTFLQKALPALIETGQPLPALERFLIEKEYREHLLRQVTDPDIVGYWHNNFDRLRDSEALNQVQPVVRRIALLTANPALKYSLGQAELGLSPRQTMDQRGWTIHNLSGIEDKEARRLLGCLLLTCYERDTLSRRDIPSSERKLHMLMIDEFGQFAHTSEQALSTMLSESRKFQVFLVMAHQTLSQTSARLQGALQNAKIRIVMKVGREDAEVLAKQIGVVDPYLIKHEVTDLSAAGRSHPVFLELASQWELWVQSLVNLKPRQALVKVADQPAVLIRTRDVPNPPFNERAVEKIKARYRKRLMKHVSEITLPHQSKTEPSTTSTPRVNRSSPLA